ncbi:Bctyr1 [Botrytis cinerea B05.10]|nr:Bctyr1 [Botrytis cinerea B05.10]ATZ48485.1 Bctyr1 [Botrytis cinerea B05.10]
MAVSIKSNLEGKMDNFVIGIIGMGDMGKMYARRLSDAGWR